MNELFVNSESLEPEAEIFRWSNAYYSELQGGGCLETFYKLWTEYDWNPNEGDEHSKKADRKKKVRQNKNRN